MPVEFRTDPRVTEGACWLCAAPASGALIVQGPDERYSFYACDSHIEAVLTRAIGALVRVFGKDALTDAIAEDDSDLDTGD